MCWTMSDSRTVPEGWGGPVQGPLYRWRHYRNPWQRSEPEQPLDRYKWRTSARLAPRAAKMADAEGREQHTEQPRFNTISHDRRANRPHEGPAGAGSVRRIFPYLRSMSEPGTGNHPDRPSLRKVGSDGERRASSVSSFISSVTRRISRVLRDEPEPEPGPAGDESGRRDLAGFMCDGRESRADAGSGFSGAAVNITRIFTHHHFVIVQTKPGS